MLILSRKIGESVIINDDIKMTILSIKGNQVRLGSAAPKYIKIHREEIYERIKLEKEGKEKPQKNTTNLGWVNNKGELILDKEGE